MARAEDDSWDIFQSVGVTALALAEWRARESEREPPLISDPYAHFFVDEATARGSSSLIYANLFPWMQENTPALLLAL